MANSASSSEEVRKETPSFRTTFSVNLDPKDEHIHSIECAYDTKWRDFITSSGDVTALEADWRTPLFDQLSQVVFVLPSSWSTTFVFDDHNQSVPRSIFLRDMWIQMLKSFVEELNHCVSRPSALRSKVEFLRTVWTSYASVKVTPASTISSVVADVVKLVKEWVHDWARTTNQVECPISQMPLEQPAWFSKTGRTYSMPWLIQAITSSFKDEQPLRLEDTTIFYYDCFALRILPHPTLWNVERDGDTIKPMYLDSIAEDSLAHMKFDKISTEHYNLPSFPSLFMNVKTDVDGNNLSLKLEHVIARYNELREEEPLPPKIATHTPRDANRLVVQHTIMRGIVLWKAHLKLPITFVNVLFEGCVVNQTCWCCMQLKRCRFENCLFTESIVRCEFINCEFVNCRFVGDTKDLGDDPEKHNQAFIRQCDFNVGKVTFTGCRIVEKENLLCNRPQI